MSAMASAKFFDRRVREYGWRCNARSSLPFAKTKSATCAMQKSEAPSPISSTRFPDAALVFTEHRALTCTALGDATFGARVRKRELPAPLGDGSRVCWKRDRQTVESRSARESSWIA